MNRIEIQKWLLRWLHGQGLETDATTRSEVVVTVGDGKITWTCRIICENAPATVHYLSRLPGRLPESLVANMAIRLLDLNRQIRFGQFSLDSQRRTITFRLTQQITKDAPLDIQFCNAMTLSHRIMTTHGQILLLFLDSITSNSVHKLNLIEQTPPLHEYENN